MKVRNKKKSYYKGSVDIAAEIKEFDKKKEMLFKKQSGLESITFNVEVLPFSKFSSFYVNIPHAHPHTLNQFDKTEFEIPLEQYKSISILFEGLEINPSLQPILLMAFISMTYAAIQAPKFKYFKNLFQNLLSEAMLFMKFLEELKDNKKKLTGLHFNYSDNEDANKNYHNPKEDSISFKGHIAANFLQLALKNFKETKDEHGLKMYDIISSINEAEKKGVELQDPFFFKSQKELCKYYVFGLVHFLLRYHVNDEDINSVKPFPSPNEWSLLEQRKKKNTNRELYLFVGRLVELSGLIKNKKPTRKDGLIITEYDDENLVDLIEKMYAYD